ncbi:serine/threonine-protein kinase [Streptomyces sp. NPDC001380]|uniref:serine/threonine-protein kinase n=1 Tax=Streptomyces sp. NPDC001380 TaxID=3364566 RepID=UPI00369D6E73
MGTQDGSAPGAAAAGDRAAPDAGAAGDGGRLLAGRYLLGERLGRGGMGTVWRAEDRMLDREVAVKELSVRHLPEEDLQVLQSRMKQEARAAARIKHPGVITVHDVLEQDGRPWIVMELVDGRSLADVIAQEGTLLPRDAAGVGVQVLAALHRGHEVGVLHRDVKPANVLLERGTGRVVLTDFGIAVLEGSSALTRTGDLVGSPDYLAPERAQGHRPGPESDLWALGATLYAAVEGDSPFHRSSPLSTLAAVVGDPLPEPRRAGALAPVLRALLEKDPHARPTADEAMRMLEAVAAGHTMGITPVPSAALRTPTQAVPVVDRSGRPDGAPDGAPSPTAPTAVVHAPAYTPAPAPAHVPAAAPLPAGPAPVGGPVRRAGRGRRTGLLAAGALVAALLGGGAVYAALPHGKGQEDASGKTAGLAGRPSAGGPSRRGAVPPQSSPSAPSPDPSSPSGPSADQGATTADPGAPAPDGYTWTDDPEGFRFLLPSGQAWSRTVNQGQIDYSPDPPQSRRHFIRFAVTQGQTQSPLEHAESMQQQVRLSQGYHRVQLVPNVFKGHDGAVWEFTYEATAGPRHVVEQLYRDGQGTEYAIYLSYPEEDWTAGQQRFTTVRNSFSAADG